MFATIIKSILIMLFAGASLAQSIYPLGLPEETYVEFSARLLRRPRVVWMDPEWVRDVLQLHPTMSKAQMESAILKRYGYVTWPEGEVVGSQTQKFLADRYGSVGLNGNLGAARVHEDQLAQVKGGGTNPLLGPLADEFHRDGKLPLSQALKEGLWAEILMRELPFGANRTIAVIDTGAAMQTHFGTTEPSALIVRENPLRPAHFMINPHARDIDAGKEESRVAAVREHLQSLWSERLGFMETQSYEVLFTEFTRRIGIQYGFAYAHGIHHGGATPSNIDLNGAFLDLSTMTMVDGFQKVLGWDLLPHGDPQLPFRYIIAPFLEELRQYLPDQNIPKGDAILRLLEKSFWDSFNVEILRRAGIPDDIAQKIQNSTPAKKFLETMIQLIETHRQHDRPSKGESPARSPHEADISNILKALSNESMQPLAGLVPDEVLRKKLRLSFQRLLKANSQIRVSKGRTKLLNRHRTDLFRRIDDHAFKGAAEIVETYMRDGDAKRVNDQIDALIRRSAQPTVKNQYRSGLKCSKALR